MNERKKIYHLKSGMGLQNDSLKQCLNLGALIWLQMAPGGCECLCWITNTPNVCRKCQIAHILLWFDILLMIFQNSQMRVWFLVKWCELIRIVCEWQIRSIRILIYPRVHWIYYQAIWLLYWNNTNFELFFKHSLKF